MTHEVTREHAAETRPPTGTARPPPVVAKDLSARIEHARGSGSPLDAALGSRLERVLGALLGDVRVHAGSEADALSRALGATAFTTGSDVFFRRGAFSPGTELGRDLLLHELTHVLQQRQRRSTAPRTVSRPDDEYEREARSVAAGAERAGGPPTGEVPYVQRQPAAAAEPATALSDPAHAATTGPSESLAEERRLSVHEAFYVELDPPTAVVPIGQTITFRLGGHRGVGWVREAPDLPARPRITVTSADGRSITWFPRKIPEPGLPWEFDYTFERPGHFRIAFDGKPVRPYGPEDNPFALADYGEPIHVTVEVDVVAEAGKAELDSERLRQTARLDVAHLEDPHASLGEIGEAFKRIAIRRGLEILNRNRQEAQDLLSVYTAGTSTRTGEQAAEELKQVLELDAKLDVEMGRIHMPRVALEAARREGKQILHADELLTYVDDKVARIRAVRAALQDAFPALVLIRRGGMGPYELMFLHEPAKRIPLLRFVIGRVIDDCNRAERALLTGDLDVLDADLLVEEVRKTLGIDQDEGKRLAIDEMFRLKRRREMVTSLAFAGVSLLLLLIPGIGPFLAAGAGFVAAGFAWERAGDLSTAAGAGVREGIVSRREAMGAAFWATLDTLLAGLDVVTALKPVAKILPHAPAAAERLLPRAAVRAVEEVAPRAGEAGAKAARDTFAMTAEDLSELATRLFKRPVRPMSGQVHFYGTWEEYVAAWRKQFPNLEPPGGGYYNELTGHLHVSPRGNMMTVVHEAAHKVAHETFPMGRELLGDFLDEGITEAITRTRLGPRAARHPYDLNVAFVSRLESAVGRDAVENAVLHGDYRGLREAVKRALGGSEKETFQFFAMMRGVGAEAGMAESKVLDEALGMLERRAAPPSGPRPAAPPPLPGVRKAPEALTEAASAALKRIEKVAGKEVAAKAEKALGTIVFKTDELTETLGRLAQDARLPEDLRGALQRAQNALRDHLTADDLTGALRDNLGIPIRERGSGEAFEHIGEVRAAVNSLDGARDQLLREMRRHAAGSAEFLLCSNHADVLQELMLLIRDFLAIRR